MGDFIWFIVIGAVLVLLGFVFIELGLLIWKKQKMDLIIHHHCDKVSKENEAAYCRLAGIGVFVMGIGFAVSGICAAFMRSALVFLPMGAGLAAGIVLLILAGSKYNR